jgi:hypothetical protein
MLFPFLILQFTLRLFGNTAAFPADRRQCLEITIGTMADF